MNIGVPACGHCIVMSASCECVCRAEIDKVAEKMQEGPHEVTCITAHEGFEAVCLNVMVLKAAYFQYRQQYGDNASCGLSYIYSATLSM